MTHCSYQIDRQQVDAFKSWQKVPYCRLQVKLDKDREPVELEHKVKLRGATSPFDFFTITCPPEGKHFSAGSNSLFTLPTQNSIQCRMH